MILHIVKDDKFIGTITKIFEAAAPNQNIYAVWREAATIIPSLFHTYKINKSNNLISQFPKRNANIHNSKHSNPDTAIEVSEFGTKEFFNTIGDLSKYKLIVFHSLVYNHAKLLHLIKSKFNIPIIWSPFGYEVYNMLPEFRNELYQEKTKEFLKKHKTKTNRLFNLLTPLKAKTIRTAIRKTNYCSISIDTEFQTYKEKINPQLKQYWFTYYPLDILIKDDSIIEDAPNILLGNSAFPSNNHLEAFELLKKQTIGTQKIITPLSYGDPQYALEIKRIGEKMFGNNFTPLLSFMPLEEYNTIVKSCGIVIMNQNRQQAFGNILSSVWFGAKVFLHPDNTIYSYLKKLGVHIFSTHKLENEAVHLIQRLSNEEAAQNRDVLTKEYSFKNIVSKTKVMINELS